MKVPATPILSLSLQGSNFLKTGGDAETVHELVDRINKIIRRDESSILKDVLVLAEELTKHGILQKSSKDVVQLYSIAEKFPRISELPPIANPNVIDETLELPKPKPSKYLGIIDQVPYYAEGLTKSEKDQLLVSKFYQIKVSADARGKDFQLTIEDVRKLLTKKRCAYTDVALVDSPTPSKHGRTVDRIDPNKGYIPGNVVAVTSYANTLKNLLFETSTSAVYTNFSELLKMMDKLNTLGFTNEHPEP